MPAKPAKRQSAIFGQVCELIPAYLVPKLARKHELKSPAIKPWHHLVAMLYAQFSQAMGLNDVCAALRVKRSLLASIRGAEPPSRNGLSHANKIRNAELAEELFWTVLEHLGRFQSGFSGAGFARLPRRFKRTVHAIDASTIKLFANCMGWAKHRRRKAAAKLHLRLNLQTFLPAYAVVDAAKGHDNTKAHELCAGLKAGEIVLFDMAYIDYAQLYELTQGELNWVSRVQDNMRLGCVKRLLNKPCGRILRDDIVVVLNPAKRADYPGRLRPITALIEINGVDTVMIFFSANFEWAASSSCDFDKARWTIEVFFKQIKQTLQIGDFLGHHRNALGWQLWTALLMYVLLRFLHARSRWSHRFSRLFSCLRAVLWQRRDLPAYLDSYGPAGGSLRLQWAPQQAFLPGFGPRPPP